MEVKELKARAYDLIVTQEKIQMELRQINQEINKLNQEKKDNQENKSKENKNENNSIFCR